MTAQRDKAIPTIQLDNHQVIVTRWHPHSHDYVAAPAIKGSMTIAAPLRPPRLSPATHL